jgi:hypothetical protein
MVGCLIMVAFIFLGVALLMISPVLFFLLLALAVVGTLLLFIVGIVLGILKCIFGWL